MSALPRGMTCFRIICAGPATTARTMPRKITTSAKTGKVWDDSSKKAHWKNRKAGQPFFAVFNSVKSHESQHSHAKIKLIATRGPGSRARPTIPTRRRCAEDWARYYDIDQPRPTPTPASCCANSRRPGWPTTRSFSTSPITAPACRATNARRATAGLHVPLVVFFPENFKHLGAADYQPGGKSDRLVSFVDLAPTMLSIAGMEPPAWMQGRAFAGKHIAAADRSFCTASVAGWMNATIFRQRHRWPLRLY